MRSEVDVTEAALAARPARLAERPAGRRTRSARCAATTRCSSSRGTAPPGSSSPTASCAARSSTGTACGRCASRSRDDGLVVVCSEAGAVPLPEGTGVRRARLGPGQLLAVDPVHGLRFDGELTRDLARRRPYGAWVAEHAACRRAGRAGAGAGRADLVARHALHGYTREELSLMLRPIAQAGQEPVYSMGDDAPIAPLAGRARPLASYFRQRFAQVTNPAIDHYRERTVMSVATLVGAARAARGGGAVAAARRPPVVPRHARRAGGARAGARWTRRSRPRRASGAPSSASRTRASSSSREARTVVCLSDRDGGRRAGRDPVAPRRRGSAHAPHRARPAHRLLAPRDERRGARHAHGRDARRLRRGRGLPATRARDRRAARGNGQGRRRPALAATRRSVACSARSRTGC